MDSYLPVEGRLVLHIKDAPRVAVRLPEWCSPLDVRAWVGEQPRKILVEGRFAKVGWLHPGDRVTFTFPVCERTMHRVIGEIPYKLELRGANVVAIDPRGVAYPLYEHQPRGQLLRKRRFVPQIGEVIW